MNKSNNWTAEVVLPKKDQNNQPINYSLQGEKDGNYIKELLNWSKTGFNSDDTITVDAKLNKDKGLSSDKMQINIHVSGYNNTSNKDYWQFKPDQLITVPDMNINTQWGGPAEFKKDNISEGVAYLQNNGTSVYLYGNPITYRFQYQAQLPTGFVFSCNDANVTIDTNGKEITIVAKEGMIDIYLKYEGTSNARQASFLWDDEDDLQTVASVRSVKAAPRKAPTLATTDKVSVTGTTNTGTNTFGVNDIAKTGQTPPSNLTPVDGTSIELDGTQDTTGEYASWKAKWSNLPTVDENGNRIYYYVVETSATKSGATSMSADYKLTNADYITDVSGNIIGIRHVTITNTPGESGKISVSANKSWILTGDFSANDVDNFAVEFTLYLDVACTQIVSTTNNPQTIIGNGKATWTNLNPGTYYVKETKVSYLKNGTTTVLWDGTGTNRYLTKVEDGDIDTFTNYATTYAVQKRWMAVNGEWNKEYNQDIHFRLYRDGEVVNEKGEPDSSKVFTLTKNTNVDGVEDSTENIYLMRFPILPGGTYTVVECKADGTPLSQEPAVGAEGDEVYTHKLCQESILISGEEIAVTAIKNDLYHIKAQKNWADSSVTPEYYPAVTFTLMRTTAAGAKSWTADQWKAPTAQVVDTKNLPAMPAETTDAERTVDFGYQPRFDANGNEYIYNVIETAIPGYTAGSANMETLNESGIQRFTITNTPDTMDLYVHKVWFENGLDVTNNHTGDVIAYDVYRQAYSDKACTEANKVGDPEKIALPSDVTGRLPVEKIEETDGIEKTTYSWQENVHGLPVTGTVQNGGAYQTVYYKYYVVETAFGSFTAEYYVEGSDETNKSETATEHSVSGSGNKGLFIRNNMAPVEFHIEKIEKGNTAVKLEGAQFTIREINPNDANVAYMYAESEDTTKQTGTSDKNGFVSFTNKLTSGIYKVEETKSPDGYVITGDNFFYIKVENGKIMLLDPKSGTASEDGKVYPSSWQKLDDSAMLRYNPNSSTATVANEPGVALPASGGPGTRLFTILGSILILGAGVLLWKRRRMV